MRPDVLDGHGGQDLRERQARLGSLEGCAAIRRKMRKCLGRAEVDAANGKVREGPGVVSNPEGITDLRVDDRHAGDSPVPNHPAADEYERRQQDEGGVAQPAAPVAADAQRSPQYRDWEDEADPSARQDRNRERDPSADQPAPVRPGVREKERHAEQQERINEDRVLECGVVNQRVGIERGHGSSQQTGPCVEQFASQPPRQPDHAGAERRLHDGDARVNPAARDERGEHQRIRRHSRDAVSARGRTEPSARNEGPSDRQVEGVAVIKKARLTARQPDHEPQCEGEDDEHRDYEVVRRDPPWPSQRRFVRHAWRKTLDVTSPVFEEDTFSHGAGTRKNRFYSPPQREGVASARARELS